MTCNKSNNSENVIFIATDASLRPDNSVIVGLRDYLTNTYRQKALKVNFKNSLLAEEYGVVMALNYAIERGYRHIVVIYDCLSIKTNKFTKRYGKFFDSLQFLWLKRKYIADIDRITKKTEHPTILKIRATNPKKRDEKVINILANYAETEEELFVFSELTGRNLENKRRTLKDRQKYRTTLFSLLYFVLSKTSKKRVKRVLQKYIDNSSFKKVFKARYSNEYKGIVKEIGIREIFVKHLISYYSSRKKH